MSPQKLYIIIVGCGRLGAFLANKLSRDGHSVVAIDVNKISFDNLSEEFSGFRIEGDATEFALLQEAKADKADLIVATTHEDNVNIMVAQVAKKIFGVQRVMARVFDPMRVQVYQALDIETVSPTLIAGEMLLESLYKNSD